MSRAASVKNRDFGRERRESSALITSFSLVATKKPPPQPVQLARLNARTGFFHHESQVALLRSPGEVEHTRINCKYFATRDLIVYLPLKPRKIQAICHLLRSCHLPRSWSLWMFLLGSSRRNVDGSSRQVRSFAFQQRLKTRAKRRQSPSHPRKRGVDDAIFLLGDFRRKRQCNFSLTARHSCPTDRCPSPFAPLSAPFFRKYGKIGLYVNSYFQREFLRDEDRILWTCQFSMFPEADNKSDQCFGTIRSRRCGCFRVAIESSECRERAGVATLRFARSV